MANTNNDGADNSPEADQDSPTDKSFVGKIVSGLISNTPLSKWFGAPKSAVRRRDESDDDESFTMHQPPYKRAKLPSEQERNIYPPYEAARPSTSNNVATSRVYNSFPEPVPGPSGLNNRRLLTSSGFSNSVVSKSMLETPVDSRDREFLNGAIESDSEESTSGYCTNPQSTAKKAAVSDQTLDTSSNMERRFQNRSLFGSTHDSSRSLFSERSLSPQVNTSMSSRRPTFNASTFGTPNFIDKTMVTKRILNSPFYSGRTMYGGASAHRSRSSSESNQSRHSVQIKPANENKSSETRVALSKTARRILSTLEQYSTPISDAKKIPVSEKRRGLLSKYVGGTPYSRAHPKHSTGSTNELQVPTVPQLIQLKQKERLQNSTVSVRQIATTSKSLLNDEYQLRSDDRNRHHRPDKNSKRSNKMKSGVGTARQKPIDLEPPPPVNLPKVALPISTLPKFDFVVAPPTASIEPVSKSPPTVTITSTKTTTKSAEPQTKSTTAFKFSQPVVISSEVKKVAAINDFKFSQPLDATKEVNLNFKMPESRVKPKNNGENVSRSVSSDDQKFQKETNKTKSDGFGARFKMATDQWECSSCMVRNDVSASTCVCCSTPKTPKPSGDNKKPAGEVPTISASSWGSGFATSPDTWECTTCLVRNKNDLSKCAACETPRTVSVKDTASKSGEDNSKPIMKSLSEVYKIPLKTWECPTCMIRNKDSDVKCVACETSKPGTSATATSVNAQTYSFGINPPSSNQQPTFSFGIKPTTQPSTTSSPSPSVFSFGVKPATTTSTATAPSTTSFSFGGEANKSQAPVTSTTNSFSFGTPRASDKDANVIKKSPSGFGNTFKKKDDEWECSSCLVRNKTSVALCSCCGTRKPGSTVSQVTAEDKPINQFNFGIVKTNEFSFGIPTTVAKKSEEKIESKATDVTSTTTTAPPTFSFGTTAPPPQTGFGFGAQTDDGGVAKATVTAPVKQSNPLLKPDEKLPPKVEPVASPSTVKFAVPVTSKPPVEKQSQVSSLFGAPAVNKPANELSVNVNVNKPTFEFKPITVANGELGQPRKVDLFSNAGSKQAAPSFKFEPVTSTTANSSPTPMFKFGPSGGASTSSEATAIPSFGATTSINTNPTAVKRSFGESLENNNDFNSVTNSNGLGAKVAAFEAPKTFGASTETSAYRFGDSTKPTGGFGFGNRANPTTTAAPFKFGAETAASPQQQQQQQQQLPSVAPPSYNFATAGPTSGFNFGAAANKTDTFAPAPNVNVFGSAAAVTAAAVTAPGAAKNGSFNFGAPANSNQKAIFTFGAGQTSGANQDGGFQAAPVPPVQPTGGFNFGAAPAAPAPGGFNFTGAQPSFNFTDGTAGHPQRRIRKALRRTHR